MNKVLLVVFDGYGIAAPGPGNPISLANPPTLQSILYAYPNTTLKASGEAVGLPAGDVGNTEVGHINLGAGRIVYQDFPRINMSIADGSFNSNEAFLGAVAHLQQTGGKLHLIGLVGQGYVHSSVDHLHALVHLAKEHNIQNTFIHAITDGRDSPPRAGLETLKSLEEKLQTVGVGKVASVMGRYFAMDRDHRWERIKEAYDCITKGQGATASSVTEAISTSYEADKTDEFITPTTICANGQPLALIQEGDAVIFFNFRIDRPRELTKAFVLDNFEADANNKQSFDPYSVKYTKSHLQQDAPNKSDPFNRGPKIQNLYFVTMTEYERGLPAIVAFPPSIVTIPLGRVLSEGGVAQLRMAESEKERFIGYYFNGLREEPFDLEEHIITPSPKVATYDLKPEMSAIEQTDTLIEKMREDKYPFILINYANADMVGHTGNIEASVKAISTLDTCLGRVIEVAAQTGYTILLTADHGNVEQKINPQTGEISTEHTSNPVPFVAISPSFQGRMLHLESGILADVAPTILALMGILPPTDMTGRNLLTSVIEQ